MNQQGRQVKVKGNIKNPPSKPKTQVVTFRIPYDLYERYETRCLEKRIGMSQVARDAVIAFMN